MGTKISNSQYILDMAKKAKKASSKIAVLSAVAKNKILRDMADELEKREKFIVSENRKDVGQAKKKNLSPAMIKRLVIDSSVLKSMAYGLRQIADLDDPVGQTIDIWKRPNGLEISKVRVPLGVIAVIYESRPNVTVDCAGLCLKSGNVPILRGGKESIRSNSALFSVLYSVIQKHHLPPGSINLIERTDHDIVDHMLTLSDYIDLVIPRGGETLIRLVVQKSKIPVIKHYQGICHTYIDSDCDLVMAEDICINAKIQKPGVCNAMETLLVHKDTAKKFLSSLVPKLKKAGVEIRGCEKTKKIIKGIKSATETDWDTEYLDLILSVKIVKSIDEAIEHIAKHGSAHSDAIVTNNLANARKFVNEVDSSCVFVNASTRFSDGGEFGLALKSG